MKLKITAALVMALGAVGLEAHAVPAAQPAKCRPLAAAALVGRAPPNNATIRRRSGAATVRRIAPGDMVTQDYRESRLTVTVAKGKVTAASCG